LFWKELKEERHETAFETALNPGREEVFRICGTGRITELSVLNHNLL
jgi:hypothetical protein